MPDSITCFACEREPVQQCARCGRPYCEEHGEELCDVCMRPASGVPSGRLYTGSLFALLIATVLAIVLFVKPSDNSNASTLRPVVLTPTSAAAQSATQPAGSTQPAQGTQPAGGTAAPRTTGTPAPAATATRPAATVTQTTPGTSEYTVVSGDTLSSICSQVKPSSMSLDDCISRVVALNQLSGPEDVISIGQKLVVPK